MLSSPSPENKNYMNINNLISLPNTPFGIYSCRSWTHTQKANQHSKRFSERLWWLIFQDWNVIVIKRNMRGVFPVPHRPMSPLQELLQTAFRTEFTQSILFGLNHLLQVSLMAHIMWIKEINQQFIWLRSDLGHNQAHALKWISKRRQKKPKVTSCWKRCPRIQ